MLLGIRVGVTLGSVVDVGGRLAVWLGWGDGVAGAVGELTVPEVGAAVGAGPEQPANTLSRQVARHNWFIHTRRLGMIKPIILHIPSLAGISFAIRRSRHPKEEGADRV